MTKFQQPLIKQISSILPIVWLGMIIGVSLIATPVKFKAPLLDFATALNVGQVTFSLFNLIEWGMLASLFFLWCLHRTAGVLIGLLLICLLFQSLWLLPVLSERVNEIINGTIPTSTWHHLAYGLTEITKIVLLLLLSILTSKTKDLAA